MASVTNQGQTNARNLALQQARGKYLAIMGADNVSAPERFAKQAQYLDAHPNGTSVVTWSKFTYVDVHTSNIWKPPTNRN